MLKRPTRFEKDGKVVERLEKKKKKMAAKMCIFHASAMANDSRHGWRKIGILRSIVRNYFRI